MRVNTPGSERSSPSVSHRASLPMLPGRQHGRRSSIAQSDTSSSAFPKLRSKKENSQLSIQNRRLVIHTIFFTASLPSMNPFGITFGVRISYLKTNDDDEIGRPEKQRDLPMAEFLERHTIREALTTDTDTLKHTIAAKLLQDQQRVDFSCLKRSHHRSSF